MADDFFVKKMLVSLFSVNGMGQKGKCTNFAKLNMAWNEICLLYTSDAADE